LYYKHIAEATKVAFPDAEYVIIPCHITFSAEVNPLKQIVVLLGNKLADTCVGLLSTLLPRCMPQKETTSKSKNIVPPLGATQFLHVDVTADEGAEKLQQRLNATKIGDSAGYAAEQMLPVDFLRNASKKRKVVMANVWRNLRAEASIKSNHLAVMDAQSITEEELHAAKFKNYAIGGQGQYHISQLKTKHRLVYFPDMTHDEILCFK